MNFEREIEKKLISLLEADAYVAANSIKVARFGEINDITELTHPVITTEVQSRVNISGPLWNVDMVLDVLDRIAGDPDGTKADALYEVISDCVAAVKAAPSLLSDTAEAQRYAVDGLIDNISSARPEFGPVRLASRSARLFISWQYQPST